MKPSTKSGATARATLQSVFEKQALARPDAPAAVCGDERLTYLELNERANRLARYLVRLGVGPEVLVGLCVERSLDMVVGILGILKAGGAWIPLDPGHPRQRIAFMLEDCAAPVVVTEERAARVLPDGAFRPVRLDVERSEIERESGENVDSGATDRNLAYVIYTSGSTGKPKGVMIEHRSVVALFAASQPEIGFDERDTWTMFHSYGFDFSIWELFGALLHGGRMVVVPREVAISPAAFGALIAREGVTIVNQTPGAARQLASVRDDPAARADGWNIRKLILGGEALPAELAAEVLEWGYELWNSYGPTETTCSVTFKRVTAGDARGGIVSIGRPIRGTEAHILDEKGRPVADRAVGELHIGGESLGRGYLRRPELDREKFIPDPFSESPGARLYKTGDLASWSPSGEIEFHGRMDHQVKIRGFRIELGEIEACLAGHFGVRHAVVMAREDQPGNRRLVAYFAPRSRPGPTSSELRDRLAELLPDYMVPSVFVAVDEFPLTPNGKVDRRVLPAPPPDRPTLHTAYAAPETELEKRVADTYRELLGLDPVGVDDSFFELGGHSLIATKLVSRLRRDFRVELPLGEFFDAPTVRKTAAWVEQTGRTPGRNRASIRPAARDGAIPIGLPQENVWFLQNLEPDSRAYNFQPTLRFHGTLDPEVLRRTLDEIVRRHEIFRTTFPEVNGVPVQQIQESARAHLTVVDLRELPEDRRERELRRRIDEEIRRPFDLTRLPLARWTLFRVGPQEDALQHVEHHMIHDGWSFNVFLRELAAIYRSYLAGAPSPLPDPKLQYADFAIFQREWMRSDDAAAQRDYWIKKLSPPPAALVLPTDHPRPDAQTFRGKVFGVEIPADLADSLRALSRREGSTLFMTMLATFAALLHRYTDREDFCVGSGIANRRWEESEDLIGMLVNTVALRMDLSDDPPFEELLRRVRRVTLEGYEHQDYPFAAVVDAVQPERTLRNSPLIQVLFSFHDSPLAHLEFGGPQLDLHEIVSNGSAKFDLNIVCIPRTEQRVGQGSSDPRGGITIAWEYSSDLFDETTARRMSAHFETLLRGVASDPTRRVSELPLLTSAEERQILFEFNEPAAGAPRSETVHQLFEAQARRTPDAPALVSEAGVVTYGELNGRANQLAHCLRREGLGKEDLVGVCLERSPELIVGLLGILKAGGAYVPIDPSYPPERIAFLAGDSGIRLVLSARPLAARLPADGALRALNLDSDAAGIASESTEDPESGSTADSLAYVMYTSGSTGKPKGVAIPHRGIVRLAAPPSFVRVTAEDTFLQLASISFDASTFEIWGALINGARLALMPPGSPSLHELAEVIARHRVSVLWLTSGLFHQMVDEVPRGLRAVSQVLTGGDVVSLAHAREFLRANPESRLINGYGPTENTTFTCCYPVRDPETLTGSVPIGRPIARTRVYLLDRRGRLVPIGVAGELHAAGEGLARGYLHHPEQTAERFVPDPFDPNGGGRLYRTGDFARYLPDGTIEFEGRRDSQVKIRGYRVELAEIEAALMAHGDVRDAVVVADGDVDRRLLAYYVPVSEKRPSGGELRRFLARSLPEFMIPSAYYSLESLPLTPNGKVDRRALPPPDGRRLEETRFVPLRSDWEKALAQVWKDVLEVDRIGAEDNFFDLGGHSLLATRVVSRVRDQFGIEISIRSLFESPTLASFADALSRTRANARPAILPVN